MNDHFVLCWGLVEKVQKMLVFGTKFTRVQEQEILVFDGGQLHRNLPATTTNAEDLVTNRMTLLVMKPHPHIMASINLNLKLKNKLKKIKIKKKDT